MSIRRQGYEWIFDDIGGVPVKKIAELTEKENSIFTSGIGNATITVRNKTPDDAFIVIDYVGSTPGIWPQTGPNWKPRGYVQIVLESTSYFEDPDWVQNSGIGGSTAPYPISVDYQPAYSEMIPIEIPPNTNWDVKYRIFNAVVESNEVYTCPSDSTAETYSSLNPVITFN